MEEWFERTLHLDTRSGSGAAVVRIGNVRQMPGGEWGCHFSIGVLEPKTPLVCGVDALQAIDLCVRTVAEYVRAAEDFDLWRIWWLVPGDHGGFFRAQA